jgi:hypothetical protein
MTHTTLGKRSLEEPPPALPLVAKTAAPPLLPPLHSDSTLSEPPLELLFPPVPSYSALAAPLPPLVLLELFRTSIGRLGELLCFLRGSLIVAATRLFPTKSSSPTNGRGETRTSKVVHFKFCSYGVAGTQLPFCECAFGLRISSHVNTLGLIEQMELSRCNSVLFLLSFIGSNPIH